MTLSDDINPFRLEMPRYEHIHPWLSLLLDCYAVIDYSVDKQIFQSEKIIACHKGCSYCCYQTIPLSTIESLGIKFYISTILSEKFRQLLINKFNKKQNICLFNVDNCCIVYQLRPIACRRYIITSQCCQLNEDPTITRQDDVLYPSREYLYNAIEKIIPFYHFQNIHFLDNEHIFDFYKRQNVKLSSIYDKF
jgi:hypothetical protein